MAVLLPLALGQVGNRPDSATLQGTVRGTNNQPLAGATVSLLPKSSSQALTATTDVKGSYRFSALPDGSYTVSAAMAGYGDATAVPVVLEKKEAKTIDLTLRAIRASQPRTAPAGTPEFFDEPTFTVAGVTDTTNLGGHGSNATQPTKEALTKATVSLSKKEPARSPAAAAIEKSLRDTAERNPGNFEANHQLGRMLVADGRALEALPYLERASQLSPGNYDNSYQLAVACAQAGNYERARTTVQALLVHQDKAELHDLLGDVEERLGNPLAAVHEYQRAAEMNPSEAYLFDWGSELLAHRAFEPAVEVFTKGHRLFAGSSRMLIGLGVASYARGDVDAAIQRLCAASDLNPNDPTPYLFLGRIQNVETTRSVAISARLEQFAQLQPDNALASYYYALSLWKGRKGPEDTAKLEQIESLLEKALRLNPSLGPAYLQLGVLHAERKEFPKAIGAYQKAIETSPAPEEAHYRLAQVYRQTGEGDKARSEIQLYEQISKERAKEVERERHDIQQFVYTLRDQAPSSPQ